MIQLLDKEARRLGVHRQSLIKNGRSQAVRLPKEFRFKGSEVKIRKEGDKIILASRNHRLKRKRSGKKLNTLFHNWRYTLLTNLSPASIQHSEHSLKKKGIVTRTPIIFYSPAQNRQSKIGCVNRGSTCAE
jgi:virulence-associated protein VagC